MMITELTRQKMRIARTGLKHSEETKRKISESHKGEHNPFWGKRLSIEHREKISKALTGRKYTDEAKRNMSKAQKGRQITFEHRQKISESLRGRKLPPFSEEHKKKIGEANRGKERTEAMKRNLSILRRGDKNRNWRGGISSLQGRLRIFLQCRQWRQQVFMRDDFTCQQCGDKTINNLESHHIKSLNCLLEEAKTYLPRLDRYEACLLYAPLWNIDNGITLCKRCHGKLKKRVKG